MSKRPLAAVAGALGLAITLPVIASAPSAAAQSGAVQSGAIQSGSAEWFPAFDTPEMVGGLDRRSIHKPETYAFPATADIRRIRFIYVPKAGAPYGNKRYGYVLAQADVACDLNQIVWGREEYFHFGETEPGSVLTPPVAEVKAIAPDSVDYQVAYGACTDNAMTGTPFPSADQFAVRAKAHLMASTPPPRRTGWMIVKTDPQQVMALDMGSIAPATGQYAGSDLLAARTITLNRGGTVHAGVSYGYVIESHLIRCRAGATARSHAAFHNFDNAATPAQSSRTIGPQLTPVTPGSAGYEALSVACGLVPATTETFELQAILPTLRGMAGL